MTGMSQNGLMKTQGGTTLLLRSKFPSVVQLATLEFKSMLSQISIINRWCQWFETSLQMHQMSSTFITSLMSSSGAPPTWMRIFTCTESCTHLLPSTLHIKNCLLLQGNLVAVFHELLLHWCSGQMLHAWQHLATQSYGCFTCFLGTSPNIAVAHHLWISVNTLLTSKSYVVQDSFHVTTEYIS